MTNLTYTEKKRLNWVLLDLEIMGKKTATVMGRNRVCAAMRLIEKGFLREVSRIDLGKKTPYVVEVEVVDAQAAQNAIARKSYLD